MRVTSAVPLDSDLLGATFEVPLVGDFNIRNAAMAASAAHFYGISIEEIQHALKSFKGIKRRQEVRGEVNGVTVIDDFGHHPTAIRETLAGLHSSLSAPAMGSLRAALEYDPPRRFPARSAQGFCPGGRRVHRPGRTPRPTA